MLKTCYQAPISNWILRSTPISDFSNPAATVSIKVSQYGDAIASINVYLATGENPLDATGWKLIKNIPYTGEGTLLSVTTAEIAAALAPNAIMPGTQYRLENEVVTSDGRKFSDANTPTSYSSFPAYNLPFRGPLRLYAPLMPQSLPVVIK